MSIKSINNVLILVSLFLVASYLQKSEVEIEKAYSYEVSPIQLNLAQGEVSLKSM